jgi:hypothetical protein
MCKCCTYVIRASPGGGKESILAINAPHCAYYVQDGMDLGVLLDDDIHTTSVRAIESVGETSND